MTGGSPKPLASGSGTLQSLPCGHRLLGSGFSLCPASLLFPRNLVTITEKETVLDSKKKNKHNEFIRFIVIITFCSLGTCKWSVFISLYVQVRIGWRQICILYCKHKGWNLVLVSFKQNSRRYWFVPHKFSKLSFIFIDQTKTSGLHERALLHEL